MLCGRPPATCTPMSIDMSIEPRRRRSAAQAPLARPRRRDTLLAALEQFRALHPGITVANIVTFLYVCENENLNLTELALVSGMSKATASRAIRALAPAGSRGALAPAVGLVQIASADEARAHTRSDVRGGSSKALRLTDHGQQLRATLEALITDAVPISPQGEPLSREAAA